MIKLNTPQLEFLEKVEQSRKEGKKKGLLIFPTGLGKTFAALSDALKFKGRLLILAHNQDLLRQHGGSFRDLCKDRKMGFMYKLKKDFGADVIFGNVRTVKNHINKFKKDEFDYIIIDETHHAAAKTYRSIMDYFTPKFLLGVTATPTRTDRKDILPLYDNNTILEYSEQESIEKRWLRPYKIVALWDRWCDYGDIKCYPNGKGFYKYDIRKVGKKYLVPERIEGIIDILKNGINKNDFKFDGIGAKKGIYFSPRCIVAKRYCEEFNKAGIKSVYIDGRTSSQKRRKILKDFENGKYQLILNVNLIGEGFHIPKVDMVIIDRPTDSKILWNQQKGRQIFNIEGQSYDTKGLLIDFVGNSKNSFKSYVYNLPKKQYKKNEIKEIIERSIGVECEFQPEVIDYVSEISHRKEYSKEELIEEYYRVKKLIGHTLSFSEMLKYSVSSISPYQTRFGSWVNFLKSIGEKPVHGGYTKQELIDEYFRLKEKLKKRPSSIDIHKYGKFSLHGYYRLFGTYIKFLESINEPTTNPLIVSKKQIINEYYRLKKLLKHPPTVHEIDKYGKFSSRCIWKQFGGLNELKKEIREPLNSMFIDSTKSDLIKNYYTLKEKLGRQPRCMEISNKTKYPLTRYSKKFGGWNNFLKEIGEPLHYKYPTKKELIREYYKIKKSLNKNRLTSSDIDKHSIYSDKQYFKYWGTWYKLLKEINEPLEYKRAIKVTKKVLINEYYQIKNKLKKQPTLDDWQKNTSHCYSTLGKQFKGGWYGFLKEINEPIKKVTKETLIEDYKKLKEKLGRPPRANELGKINDIPCKGIFIKFFGSWNNFLKERGDCYYNIYTEKEIIDNYYKVKNKLGRVPNTIELGQYGSIARTNYGARFGSYKDFLKKIGDFSLGYNKSFWNELESKKIDKRYINGEGMNKLAKETSVTDITIKRYLKSKGIKIRSRGEQIALSKPTHLFVCEKCGNNHVGRTNQKYCNNCKGMVNTERCKKWYQKHQLTKNIKIIKTYKPKTVLLPSPKRNKKGSIKEYEWGNHHFKTEKEKIDIRKKIIEKIQEGDKVLLLESPELSAIKEIEQQDKKPSRIVIPNHLEFNKVAKELQDYKTDLKIELINTSVLQYLVDSKDKFDFIWLDYCGAFSYYIKDLDVLFAKRFSDIKLVLTYNLFDPVKDDDSYYFTRVIDYVLNKVSGENKIRLIKDISYRYKKTMYNIGFDIGKTIVSMES